jgi:hypothetical protein
MAKFESPAVVRRKLQVDFGEDTPTEACIKRTFERFCETGTVKDLTELRRRINNEIESISKETLCNVFFNIVKRMHLCVQSDGNHFEHLL